jgi:trk system potassium uptake protein TrkH
MNARLIIATLAAISSLVSLCIMTSLPWAFYYGEDTWVALAVTSIATSAVGGAVYVAFREPGAAYGAKEALIIVSGGWLLASVIGSLPYLATGVLPNFVDALFESVSGFSTTGASVIADPESLPKSLLFWRSTTHWLGGMGIVVLSVAVMPFLGVGGMGMLKAEVPSPVVDRLRPRVAGTARALWKVYIILTGAEVFLLALGGMNLFDALCHTFGTVATGGFSTKTNSIAHYNSAYIDVVVTVFMLAAGLNFTLHFEALKGNLKAYLQATECRTYLMLFIGATLLITFQLWGTHYDGLGDALRQSGFQVASIMTTTGYVTADWEQWPYSIQWLLLCLMFVGGCAGSTGGGMKCLRLIVAAKHVLRELFLLIHPRAVIPLKVDRRAIAGPVVNSIMAFLSLFVGVWVASTLLLIMLEADMITAVGAVTATLSNVGPGLAQVGALDNYAWLSNPSKLLLTFDMLVGRLELFTVLVLFTPAFWRE